MNSLSLTDEHDRLRIAAFAAAGAGTLFWLYTFVAIARAPMGDGSGLQWLAVVPLGGVFLFAILPGLVLAFFRKTAIISLFMGVIGLALFTKVWLELLTELYH